MEKLLGLDLFSGIGGITLALQDWIRPITYCERDSYAQGVLLSRMLERRIPKAPIWDDVRTLKGELLPIKPEIIYGGFPCTDISTSNANGKGLEGERSGLFFEIIRLSNEIGSRFIFLENVPNIRTRGLDTVVEELTKAGYDCRWCMLSASEMGARHKRERWFLLAHSTSIRLQKYGLFQSNSSERSSTSLASNSTRENKGIKKISPSLGKQETWDAEPNVDRVVDGLPFRVDRIKCLGNSVVPQQAKEAFKRLIGF